MKKIILQILLLIGGSINSFSQLERLELSIEKNDLQRHIKILASDEFEGRETFHDGQKEAAKYISDFFKKCNISYPENLNSYYQKFNIFNFQSQKIHIEYDGKIVKNYDEIVYHGKLKSDSSNNDSVVFIGSGSKADLKGLCLKNKSILLYGTSYLEKIIRLQDSLKYNTILYIPNLSQEVYLANFKRDKWSYYINRTVSNDFKMGRASKPYNMDLIDERVSIFQISPRIGEDLLGITIDSVRTLINNNRNTLENQLRLIDAKSINYKIDIKKEELTTENVIGVMKGTESPNEWIVLSAHYDHIGKKDSAIFYGADDNASGVAGLLEIAEAFSFGVQKGYRPSKSLIFLLTSGEEKGLWGSKYFVNSPIFKEIKIVANLNMDMIGRVDTLHSNGGNYLYVKGDSIISKKLFPFFQNSKIKDNPIQIETLRLSKGSHALTNSDHASFLEKNIPSVTITSGVHCDYHKPSDTYDQISFDIITDRVKLIYRVICEIINAS